MILDKEPGSFDIRVDAEIERPARQALDGIDKAKASFEASRERLGARQRATAALLTSSGMTTRDVGYLMGVSHQRVAQLTKDDT